MNSTLSLRAYGNHLIEILPNNWFFFFFSNRLNNRVTIHENAGGCRDIWSKTLWPTDIWSTTGSIKIDLSISLLLAKWPGYSCLSAKRMSPKCLPAKCIFEKCLLAKCLLAKCLAAKCIFAKCLLAKCLFT